MSPRLTTSVVICAHSDKRWELLCRSLDGALDQRTAPDQVIVVIDHNPKLLATAAEAFTGRGILVVANARAAGVSGARNTGLSLATGDIIVYLDDDAVPSTDSWLQELLAAYRSDRVVAVGGRADPLWPVNRPQWFPPEFDWVIGCSYAGQEVGQVRNLMGCNMSFRRPALLAIEGFNESFGRSEAGGAAPRRPLGCDETEVCIRLGQRFPELQIVQLAAAGVRHSVHPDRTSFNYFLRRCLGEGESKRALRSLVGPAATRAESRYLRSFLLPAVRRGLLPHRAIPAGHGFRASLSCAAGFLATAFAFAARTSRTVAAHPSLATRDRADARESRVLQVTARYYPESGGIETHVHEVAQRLGAAGLDITVLTTDRSGELPKSVDGDYFRLERARAYPRNRDYYWAPSIWRRIRHGGWGLVHCQGVHTLVPVLAMAAAIRSRIPFIVTFHTGGHSSPVRSRIRYLQWRLLAPLLRRADMLIAVSRFEAAYFQRVLSVPADRIVVIRNGGSLPRTAAVDAPTGPPLLTSVGRLERYKGHHRLIAALPHVLQHYPEARVRILGTGPYKAELEAHAARLGVAERVEIGYVPGGDRAAMAKAISESTLIVMLSDYEAHPVAVMEALTLGRPVLVSRTSGLTELADDGLASCVPATANAQATAAAIVDLLRSPPAPTQITIPTWESCTDELRDVYAGLTATR